MEGMVQFMSINIPEYLLKMPQFLPNDIEGMIFTYPSKFPQIVKNYEEVAKKYYADPEGFRKYGNEQLRELKLGLNKIMEEYKNTESKDLEFLVRLDEKLNKLFCFRFWIVNYLFADGPIHSFYVDNIKSIVRKIVHIQETEKYEREVAEITQKLLQADYADEYLKQALGCNRILEELEKELKIQNLLDTIKKLVKDDPLKNIDNINKLWEQVCEILKEKDNEPLKEALHVAIGQVKMRKSLLPLYNTLTHTIEFSEENKQLQQKFDSVHKEIEEIFENSKNILSESEYELFRMSYEQAKNFAMYKDVMGSVDGKLLPFWFGIHDEIKELLKDVNPNLVNIGSGQAAMFYLLVWYLPTELKGIVMTPDFTDFSLDAL